MSIVSNNISEWWSLGWGGIQMILDFGMKLIQIPALKVEIHKSSI